MSRPIPMIDDLALDAVAWARHTARQRVVGHPVVGLAGDAQQALGRASHEVELAGVLVGDGTKDALDQLQQKAQEGAEATFTADITTALALEHVVIVEASFREEAGRPGRYAYRLLLRESPPLPPPAELDPFGGLGGVDLGFDTDILGDIADVAGAIQDAVEQAASVVSQLESLASLADLALANPLEPILSEASKLEGLADLVSAADPLRRLLGGG